MTGLRLALCASLVFVGSAALAQTSTAPSMAAANDAYFSGDFGIAIARYEALVDSGVRHEELFYNLGNAYFRAAAATPDSLGRAVYNYERALRIDPTFEDARYNLGVARAAVTFESGEASGAVGAQPWWMRQAQRYSPAALSIALLVASLLFFAGLVAVRYQTAGLRRTAMRFGVVLLGVAGIVVIGLFAAQRYLEHRVDLAVILPDRVELREAPDPDSAERGTVSGGLRIRVIARNSKWLRVRLGNGHEGWLRTESVGEL